MFRINIDKWIEKEIHATDLALLKAQDELLQAQLRVKGFEARIARLKGQQKKRSAQANVTTLINEMPMGKIAGLVRGKRGAA